MDLGVIPQSTIRFLYPQDLCYVMNVFCIQLPYHDSAPVKATCQLEAFVLGFGAQDPEAVFPCLAANSANVIKCDQI